jgi:transposase
MAGKLLPDGLWQQIEDLFPGWEPSPEGGRPPADNRTVLTAILFVLKTGIAWEDLPQELGCSYKTCKRRLAEWTARGILQEIHELLLAKLNGADQLDWSRALLDSGTIKAPLGGENAVPTQPIAAARAVSIMC